MRILIMLITFVLATALMPSQAADIRITKNNWDHTIIHIDGDIEAGDLEVLKTKTAQAITGQPKFGANHLAFQLNVNGGDIREAMKIGRFLRDILAYTKGLGNIVISADHDSAHRFLPGSDPKKRYGYRLVHPLRDLRSDDLVQNGTAGVLMYFGGVRRIHRDNSDQTNGWPGKKVPSVILSRPSLTQADFASLSPAEAASAYETLIGDIESYLEEMGAPASMLERILDVPSGRTRSLEAQDFDDYYRSEEPFYGEWLHSKCNTTGHKNVFEGQELEDFEKMRRWQTSQKIKDEEKKPLYYLYPDPDYDQIYVEQLWERLRKHNVTVNNCRKKAVVQHQLTWAKAYLGEAQE